MIFSCFEELSDMKINFHKSDLHTLEDDVANAFAQIFCCKIEVLPFKQLGVPLHYKKLKREDPQPIIDRIIKIISGWLGKNLSYRAKLILLTTCIADIPTYLMSMIKFAKWVIGAITSQMAHFFGGNLGDDHKYHFANWGLVSRKKDFGGLGVPNLRDFNMAMLASWGKKIFCCRPNDWKTQVDFNIIIQIQTCFGLKLGLVLLFGKV